MVSPLKMSTSNRQSATNNSLLRSLTFQYKSTMKEDMQFDEDFRPDRYEALLIGCTNYDNAREREVEGYDFKEFSNASGQQDVKTVENLLKKACFKEEDIKILEDPTTAQCREAIISLIDKCWTNYMNNEKTMVYFYFSGHSCFDADLQLLLNSKFDSFFPI